MKKQRKPDRRIRRTRRQLHSALHRLIKTHPYHTITVSHIVEEADISRATFYLHYDDKDQLLIGSLESLSQKLIDSLQSEDLPDTSLENLANLIFAHVAQQRPLYQALQTSYTAAFVLQHQIAPLLDIVKNRLTSIAPQAATDPLWLDRVAHQLIGMLYGQILWWLKQDPPPDVDEMARQFDDLTMTGLHDIEYFRD